MSLRDKYTDEEFEALELKASQRDFSPGWIEREQYMRVEILSDHDGHDYIVPYKLKDKFYELLHEPEEEFEDAFGQYACGGDPFGEEEFYIKRK